MTAVARRRGHPTQMTQPLLQHLCHVLYDSHVGTSIRESDYAFSIIESVHVLAITLLVGTIVILDLRLLGVVLRGCQ